MASSRASSVCMCERYSTACSLSSRSARYICSLLELLAPEVALNVSVAVVNVGGGTFPPWPTSQANLRNSRTWGQIRSTVAMKFSVSSGAVVTGLMTPLPLMETGWQAYTSA